MKNLKQLLSIALASSVFSVALAQEKIASDTYSASVTSSQSQTSSKQKANPRKNKKKQSTPPVDNRIAVSDPGMPADKGKSGTPPKRENASPQPQPTDKKNTEVTPK